MGITGQNNRIIVNENSKQTALKYGTETDRNGCARTNGIDTLTEVVTGEKWYGVRQVFTRIRIQLTACPLILLFCDYSPPK